MPPSGAWMSVCDRFYKDSAPHGADQRCVEDVSGFIAALQAAGIDGRPDPGRWPGLRNDALLALKRAALPAPLQKG
jgi:hypothetical protein